MRKQSSQPRLDGSMSATRSRCVQVSAITAFYKARTVNRTPPMSMSRSPLPAGKRQAATGDAFVVGVGGWDERQLLPGVVEMNRGVDEPRTRSQHLGPSRRQPCPGRRRATVIP